MTTIVTHFLHHLHHLNKCLDTVYHFFSFCILFYFILYVYFSLYYKLFLLLYNIFNSIYYSFINTIINFYKFKKLFQKLFTAGLWLITFQELLFIKFKQTRRRVNIRTKWMSPIVRNSIVTLFWKKILKYLSIVETFLVIR